MKASEYLRRWKNGAKLIELHNTLIMEANADLKVYGRENNNWVMSRYKIKARKIAEMINQEMGVNAVPEDWFEANIEPVTYTISKGKIIKETDGWI